MDIKFLGGAEQVGSLGMLMDTGKTKLLFDYGITPTDPPGYPEHAPSVDRAFLTHSHVDHSGMMPWLCGTHNTLVEAMPPTIDVSLLLAADSAKICGYNGYPSPYDSNDIHKTEENFRPLRYGQRKTIGEVDVIPHPAGHIPGAAMFEINTDEKMLFTGDINTVNTGLTNGAKPVKCDTLFLESTYAGRNHETRSKVEYEFLDTIEEVIDRGGQVIIPAFAVGRTQEIILLLRNSGYEVWVDGMGRAITKMYLGSREYLRNQKKLAKASSQVKMIRHPRSRALAKKAEVVVTTSGMLDGGPALQYINNLKDDPKSAILLTGYQVQGTNGQRLRDEGLLDVDGTMIRPKCELDFFDLSAHSDHDQLVKFAKDCAPQRIVLMHGDKREILAEALSDDFEVITPMNGEKISL